MPVKWKICGNGAGRMGGIKKPTTSREAIRWLYYRLKSAVAPSLIWLGWAAVAGHNAPRIHCVGATGLRRPELCPPRRHPFTFHGPAVRPRHSGLLRLRLGPAFLATQASHLGRTKVSDPQGTAGRTHISVPILFRFRILSVYLLSFFPETLRPSVVSLTLHFTRSVGTKLTGETQTAEPEMLGKTEGKLHLPECRVSRGREVLR